MGAALFVPTRTCSFQNDPQHHNLKPQSMTDEQKTDGPTTSRSPLLNSAQSTATLQLTSRLSVLRMCKRAYLSRQIEPFVFENSTYR